MDSKIILKEKNPHEKANFFSKILFIWSFKLFRRGHKEGLTLPDLFRAREVDHSGHLGDRLEKAWDEELKRSKDKGYKPSFSRAIVKSFWLEYMLCGVLQGIVYIVLCPFIPYTLANFIQYFSNEKSKEAYTMAHINNFVMNMLSIVTTISFSHLVLGQNVVGMRVRIASCSLMYRKILRLGRSGLTQTDPGQVINLMSNDVGRFDLAAIYLNYIWTMPFAVAVISYLVWQQIMWATLAALAVICLQAVLVQAYLSNLQGVLRGKIAERTDGRVKVMSELVNGVQVIKMYAWEKPFVKIVDKLRKLEVSFILRTSMIQAFSTALSVFTERFILFAAVTTFVLTGGVIRPDITFSLVQYFNLLQVVAIICFPMALAYLAESKVSISRIEEFLALEEQDSTSVLTNEMKDNIEMQISNSIGDNDNKAKDKLKSNFLSLYKVTGSWKAGTAETLRNITFTAFPGEFVGVAGLVGSGKSSLLHVILGEMATSSGSISTGGARISYASQEPWLFVATIRQNILFGLPYERSRYNKVVRACALLRDFELLPAGDMTLVGERGISLSGGQRARIGLARACYRQADIYLLDDPLSAVDTHVGQHLMSECVLGLLRHATRLLVTHQLHHLKDADKILILHNGEIEHVGDFEEISRTPLFAELIQEEETETTTPIIKVQRTLSVTSTTSTIVSEVMLEAFEEDDDSEMSATGRVPSKVYLQYFRAGSGWCLIIMTLMAFVAAQAVTSFSDLWLTNWMNAIEANTASGEVETYAHLKIPNDSNATNSTQSTTHIGGISTFIDEYMNFDHIFYVIVWAIGIFGCMVLTTTRSMMFIWVCMRSSIRMHNKMFSSIISATMRFFDTNPSGRILNRFSKDMGTVDEILPRMYLLSMQIMMVMSGILIMVAIVSPYMMITAAVCGVLMYLWTVLYLSSAQALKRMEGVTRSPVFSHVSATMAGLSTVRACGAQDMLRDHFDDKQDVHTAAWYLILAVNASFSIWLSLISSAYVVIVSYTFLIMDNGTTMSGNVGLAISQGLILVNMVQYGIKQITEVIAQMTSVERVLQFTSLPQEKVEGPEPPADWPKKARVVFKDLSLRYDSESSPVLKNLNTVIESGWKVGVVGRTGAGKSSLISALFRLAPLEGHILIDDIDSGNINLKELRSRISIIPQEPVLFSASLRYNLDPFNKYSDAEIWEALEQVELKKAVTSLSKQVDSGGSNFSAGQRQLLCLARAALARNKLLVLDEATANVDPNTDALIQKSIRSFFANCTVITVAHRLHTVADSDRIIVMEAGEIVECGHPHELLQRSEGHLTRMVRQLGAAAEQSLRDLAANAHKQHYDPTATEYYRL